MKQLRQYSPPARSAASVAEVVERAKHDVGAAFEKESLELLSRLEHNDPAEFERAWAALKSAGVKVTRLRKLLDKILASARSSTATDSQPEFDPAELEQGAQRIIESDDVLELFLDDWRKVVAGEEKNACMLYIAATARLLDRTMHVAVKGPSGSGKSEIRTRVLDFFPPESVIAFTSLSEKALLYFPDDFTHKILSMGEAVGADEQSFQDYLLRELMSEGRLRYQVPVKTGDGTFETITIEKNGPVAFMVTTTRLKLHPENETRMLSLDVDDSEIQTRAVFGKIAELYGLGATGAEVDYAPWRAFQRWLSTGERRVVVPFAPALVEAIPPKAVRLRRDVMQVLGAIKAHALLHRNHRGRNDEGRIVADIDRDYAAVRELMHDLLAETAEVKIKETVQQTFDAVAELTRGMPSDEGVTVAAVSKHMRLDKSTTSRRLADARFVGLIENLENRKGKAGKFRPTEETIEPDEMLPSPEELFFSFSNPPESPATLQQSPDIPLKSTRKLLQRPLQHPVRQSDPDATVAPTVAIRNAIVSENDNNELGEPLQRCTETGKVEKTKFESDDDPEERAAIMEYDGRMSQVEVEAIVQPPAIPDFLRR